jgi:type I restriction enzyme S subunit
MLSEFKETALGPLPTDWEVVRLGDLFSLQQGKSLSRKKDKGVSPHPFLRTANVRWGRIDLSTVDQMDFTEEEVKKLSLEFGDLLVCEGGEIGRTAAWQLTGIGYGYQNHLHRLRSKRQDVDPFFYMYWMQAGFLLLNLYQGAANVTTIANLSNSRLSQFWLPKPPLPEQRRIAHVLSTIQGEIAAQDALIAAAREVKRSLMQRLFTYGPGAEPAPTKETEIGEVPEHWEAVKLGEISEIIMGQSPPGDTYNESRDGVPLINGPAEYGAKHPIPSKWTTQPTKITRPGDILFCVRGNTTGRLNVADKEYCIGRGVAAIREIENVSETEYLFYLAALNAGRILQIASAGGSTFPNITKSQLTGYKVPSPPLGEQRQIAHILTTADRKIAAEEQRKAALQELFKSMLHQLMTGQLRLRKDIHGQ